MSEVENKKGMELGLLKRNHKLIPLGILVVALLIVITPLRTSLSMTVSYFALRSKTRVAKQTVTKMDSPVAETILLKSDHAKVIFEVISEACQANHVLIRQIDLPIDEQNSSGIVTQYPVTLEGDFVRILKSIHVMTGKLKAIKIASIKFDREDNNKKITLVARIVFQSVKPIDDNGK